MSVIRRRHEEEPAREVSALLRDASAPAPEDRPLPGEDAARAAFRSRHPQGSIPVARRISHPMGVAVAATGLLLGGGSVAAAATGYLPDPAQGVAHDWLGQVGISVPDASWGADGSRRDADEHPDPPSPAHSPDPTGAPASEPDDSGTATPSAPTPGPASSSGSSPGAPGEPSGLPGGDGTAGPTAPETPEPTAPETPEPTAPETPEPTAPETPEPTAPETPEPTSPPATPEPSENPSPDPALPQSSAPPAVPDQPEDIDEPRVVGPG